jgi:hypothetical protein
MQSAQKSDDMDPAVVAMAPKNRESLFGYQRIAKEVIASIEDRLEELMSRQSPEIRQVTYRRPLGGGLFRIGIGVLLVAGLVGGFVVWQGPRSEAVARWAPQSVIDLLSSRQDTAAEQGSDTDTMRMGASYRTMSENEGANNVAAAIEQSQLVQRMSQDIASLQQSMDQLRAGQDQMMRMMTRASSPLNAQARTAVQPPPRPIGVGPQQQTTGLAASPPPPVRRTTPIVPPFPR